MGSHPGEAGGTRSVKPHTVKLNSVVQKVVFVAASLGPYADHCKIYPICTPVFSTFGHTKRSMDVEYAYGTRFIL